MPFDSNQLKDSNGPPGISSGGGIVAGVTAKEQWILGIVKKPRKLTQGCLDLTSQAFALTKTMFSPL